MLGRNQISDKDLLKQVNQRLIRSGASQSKVAVSVNMGMVTLTGTLQHAIQRDPILKAVARVTGVKRVIDQMQHVPRTRDGNVGTELGGVEFIAQQYHALRRPSCGWCPAQGVPPVRSFAADNRKPSPGSETRDALPEGEGLEVGWLSGEELAVAELADEAAVAGLDFAADGDEAGAAFEFPAFKRVVIDGHLLRLL